MTSILQAFIFYALLVGVTLAQDNTTTSKDKGDKMIGWVSPAPRRTTWSIIWSCMSIFIVCSWKCVHLNIPTHQEAKGEWHTLQIKFLPDITVWPKAPLWKKWRRKVLWMCCIAVAPEVGVSLAVLQYVKASKDLKNANTGRSRGQKQEYTMAHAFYVQMGGIVVYDVPQPFAAQQGQGATSRIDALEVPRGRIITSLEELDGIEVKISEHEIKDLSKADIITKAFAIIQCTWLVVQCIARRAQGYAISQLELATLGFIFCAFIMHAFWWSKPFDTESRRVFPRLLQSGAPSRFQSFLSMDDLTESNPELCQQRVSELEKDRLFHFVYDIMTGHTLAEKITSTVLHVAVLVFTLIHLVAWNWEFPAPLIQQLWRWFNIGATAGFILFEVILVVCSFLDLLDVPISTYFVGICLVVVGIIYVLLRLEVLGLTFYCLSSMPERAYTTMDWLAWIPHFS
ncbi:uncharacterized protein FTOL_07911 [Fusarium torulosum]|uniref:Uncharacterized protein n=1 Tax=Fusarium torulosum TaxID=33205 RepID=A0AAE8MCT3_9HYPO|nr:uncharacterized protein FTOL_07911 [Fusarium torulosum]